MIKADYEHKGRIVEILSASFDDNKSVNYIARQGIKRKKRIRNLMEYSFDVCHRYGEIFLSEDKNACALILFPDKKKSTIWLDIKLIISCIGLLNIAKAMKRESKIKRLQAKELMYYLWFVGVDPSAQNRGTGTTLMNEIIRDSKLNNRAICLETSTLKNIPWYKKFGFTVYNELDFSYRLYFMKRDIPK